MPYAARKRITLLMFPALIAILFSASLVNSARGEDPLVRIKFTDLKDTQRDVEGKIVVTAEDGGVLLLGRDGRLWNVTPARMESREETGKTFTPMSADELGAELIKELDGKFTVMKTRHYVIATATESEYAEWCGNVFEAFFKSFVDFWRAKKIDLQEPEFPLVAIILPNRPGFAAFALKDAGEQGRSSHGYYSVPTNRMVLYDLTADLPKSAGKNRSDVATRLEASAYNVATVVHEATHQIAFNTGMHTRLADNPLWMTEGLAMFCETPDLKSRAGWKTIGALNKKRLSDFQNFIRQRRKPDSLKTLVADSRRLGGDQNVTTETYAEAWALTFFLVKSRSDKYTDYLRHLAEKKPLIWETPESRLKEFQEFFAEDLEQFDREFIRFSQKLRAR